MLLLAFSPLVVKRNRLSCNDGFLNLTEKRLFAIQFFVIVAFDQLC